MPSAFFWRRQQRAGAASRSCVRRWRCWRAAAWRLRNCFLGKVVQSAFSLLLAALLVGYVLG